ncbi:ankyrin repeat domain-containing protein [Solirubrobacter sp. CPCC 204708]|uniref:Ankyrin repeat domain-containing protein n=1 Tax=Solirubrobacter deserti TaxID=2282478 RepID=A0ABT4RNQ3_9ACTN|nr:ankyrin repeat domain-containing protein [Solirubrobacter deserti]MBE2319199.1 ankyrin repeat domain-containing protein [Solirubrobacter deserti]MDA0140205.1 ankyrin repeat domain-containing protein [Solirubrobacter deserti]
MDLVEAITSERFPWLLREQPELASATDEGGVSALLLSRYHRRPEATAALIAAGAPIGPLEAAALGEAELLEGADLTARTGDGYTPLHLAAFFGGIEAVRVLLAAGAPPDADAVNARKLRPIHSATAVRDLESVRALLEAGADPNVSQEGGYTPLHSAAHSEDFALVQLLLDFGADRNLFDDEGKIPRDMTSNAELRDLLSP